MWVTKIVQQENLTINPALLMVIHIINGWSSMDIIKLPYLKAIPTGGAEMATETGVLYAAAGLKYHLRTQETPLKG